MVNNGKLIFVSEGFTLRAVVKERIKVVNRWVDSLARSIDRYVRNMQLVCIASTDSRRVPVEYVLSPNDKVVK
jgi:hypothetical protein